MGREENKNEDKGAVLKQNGTKLGEENSFGPNGEMGGEKNEKITQNVHETMGDSFSQLPK